MNLKNTATIGYGLLLLGLIAAPFLGAYPIFVMKLMCFALFASAFNLLLGYTGLLSFGHAAFLGGAAYVAGHAIKVWGLTPEVGLLLGTAGGGFAGPAVWLAGHPPPGHLFFNDHAGAGPDAVLCVLASALHRG